MNNPMEFHFGLIGWPLGHSFSPILHAAALKSCGFDGEYQLLPVPPLPEGKRLLEKVLQQVRSGNLHGMNVTIPHKQNVIPLLDQLTPSAREIGAVNTIYVKNGQLMGDNTDAEGFLRDLNNKMPRQPEHKLALVLGAGGSSRAVTYALSRGGWQVIVAARRLEQAQALASDLSTNQQFVIEACCLSADDFKKIHPALIVNTTPVGMSPNTSDSPLVSGIPFPKNCFVYDLVYNPLETTLIQRAKNSGLQAFGGLGMLVEQAALSFEIWTGHSPSRAAMLDAVTQHLEETEKDQEESHDASIFNLG